MSSQCPSHGPRSRRTSSKRPSRSAWDYCASTICPSSARWDLSSLRAHGPGAAWRPTSPCTSPTTRHRDNHRDNGAGAPINSVAKRYRREPHNRANSYRYRANPCEGRTLDGSNANPSSNSKALHIPSKWELSTKYMK